MKTEQKPLSSSRGVCLSDNWAACLCCPESRNFVFEFEENNILFVDDKKIFVIPGRRVFEKDSFAENPS